MPEYSNYVESRTPIDDGDVDGTEIFAVSKDGQARSMTTQQAGNLGLITREFNRTFSAELLFDKNEIEYAEEELSTDLDYTVAATGHLTNQFSSAVQRIKTDGTRTVTFTGFNFVLGDIQSGSIPEAGTYLVLFLYWNGVATVNWTKPSLEVANLVPLSAPANFAANPGAGDPETEVDLTWDAVTNASSYEIYVSTTGGDGPWGTAIATPASGDTSYTHTGRAAGTTYHYRIRAIGDQIAFSNSQYSVDATTTEDAGDVTAPTFTFFPLDAATDIAMNKVATITASAPLRDQDGTTVITNANLSDYLTVKEDDALGADIPYTATIDATKTIITITPNLVWPALGDVFIEINGVESSVNSVHAVADSATFTANDYTEMNGNYLSLGTQIDSIIVGADKNFELEAEYDDFLHTETPQRGLFQKHSTSNARSFIASTQDDNIIFAYYNSGSATREITWANALAGFTSGKITFKYFGAIDTNDGLDRVELYIDDVLISAGKSITATFGTFPFDISSNAQPFYLSGPTFREVKNFKVRNNMGATTIVDIPVIRNGVDNSGNSFDGVWL